MSVWPARQTRIRAGAGILFAMACQPGEKGMPETGDSEPVDYWTDAEQEAYLDCLDAPFVDPNGGGAGVCGGVEGSDALGFPMIGIAAGSFVMGAPRNPDDTDYACLSFSANWYFPDAFLHHDVTLTRDFWIGTTEVTQAEYVSIMGELPEDSTVVCDSCPVMISDNDDAQRFANALSDLSGLERCYCEGDNRVSFPDASPYECEGYRLPTEAEWEYAARAGTNSEFSNGGDIPPGTDTTGCAEVILDDGTPIADFAWYCGNVKPPDMWYDSDDPYIQDVAQLAPNPWGLFDMSGNAAELVADRFFDYPTGAVTDPFEEGNYLSDVVVRGGSVYSGVQAWYDLTCLTSGARQPYFDPAIPPTGFRIARTCR